MTEPTFDADGYPTDETLEALETWDWHEAAAGLKFAAAAWHWPEWVGEELRENERGIVNAETGERFVRFATGGWSGNESVIAALKRNRVLCALTWCLSARGGLHIFKYPRS